MLFSIVSLQYITHNEWIKFLNWIIMWIIKYTQTHVFWNIYYITFLINHSEPAHWYELILIENKHYINENNNTNYLLVL